MDSKSLHLRRSGLLAGMLALAMLVACGGGQGGYADTGSVASGSEQVSGSDGAVKFEYVLGHFESGVGGLASFDTAGNENNAVTLAASSLHATQGTGTVAATLNANAAMIGLTPLPLTDWREYRSVLVDVYSDKAIAAADIALVTKSGTGWTWCLLPAAQGVKAGAKTTLSFQLDWRQTANCHSGTAAGDVKAVYVKVGGGTGNVVYVDNLRVTKAVRVMALGDSITGAPGCWRKKLLELLPAGSRIDMVGVRRNTVSECGADWDSENAAFGGMRVTTIGPAIGLAGAARTDRVKVSDGVASPGNLEVWLEQTRPDLVMMNLATNDLGNNVAPSTILTGYDTLIAQIRASNPKTRILVAKIGLFNPRTAAWTCIDCSARAAAFNTALDAWAQCATTVDSPVSVVDLATGWAERRMTGDGVHPNAIGHTIMANLWKSAVETSEANFDQTGPGPARWCAGPGPDIANGTASGSTYTITSFKTGLGSFTLLTNAGVPASEARVQLDTLADHATEGAHSASVMIAAQPPGGWTGFASESNGGVADWAGYRYLRFDVRTGDTAFAGSVVVQTIDGDNWTWCESSNANIAPNSAGTLTLDLASCSGAKWAAIGRFQLAITGSPGTFHVDNVRLDAN